MKNKEEDNDYFELHRSVIFQPLYGSHDWLQLSRSHHIWELSAGAIQQVTSSPLMGAGVTSQMGMCLLKHI